MATAHPIDRTPLTLLIAAFKLLKGILLVGVGIVVLKLVHRDVADVLTRWAPHLMIDPHGHWVEHWIAKAADLNPRRLTAVGFGTFLYAVLFFTEAYGLFLGRYWGEYVTIFSTGGFVPLELTELVRHPSWTKAWILTANVLIVLYLVRRVLRRVKGR